MEFYISQLIEYAVRKGWLEDCDRIWAANRILEALHMDGFDGLINIDGEPLPLHEILEHLCDYAYEHGVIDGNSSTYFDLLDTHLMGLLIPRPGEIIKEFRAKCEESPKTATDWYYKFSGDTNYIRRDRIAKDMQWTADTGYGTLDITVNLSKPEKDPKAIAAAGKAKSTGYPKCLLCIENEGYAGRLDHPARQNHRIIPIDLNGNEFFMQYSPYVYYNEHCIVFNKQHIPMHIDEQTFRNLLEFITIFPHYFIGSNADLPIVGGSVLSHDHYQGGNFEFAMARAEIETHFTIPGFEDVETGIVKWPMSVIRIKCQDKDRLTSLATHILAKWRIYDDEDAFIFHETNGEPHNTITPIARRRGNDYELDLVLRNNITTDEYPLGVFHPHCEYHHIKKENIGLIEVMGLAVLPARLDHEMDVLCRCLVNDLPFEEYAELSSHLEWAETIRAKYGSFDKEKAGEVIRKEIGCVFVKVLENAGVFKCDDEGRAAFNRFIQTLIEES